MSVEFFRKNAGFSYNPKTETKTQGRNRCANRLADAEREGRDAGLAFDWSIDSANDSGDFNDDGQPAYELWQCVCYDAAGKIAAVLCGIDFGDGGEPWGDPYRRVVEAEMASEALPS